MKFLFISVLIYSLTGCAMSQDTKNNEPKIPQGNSQPAVAKEAVAYFSEGCFWHTEIVFQSLAGVRDAVSGYSGGDDTNPDYEEVSTGGTGHAETVQVFYDPAVISFETLVRAFFASHDPTQLNRQGNDVGSQYRSIAFYKTEQEKQVIDAELKKLKAANTYSKPVVTEIKPFTRFYPAEEYHQEYISQHPENPYVKNVSVPEYLHFRKTFTAKFKDGI
jgi:peptide-methionine (S)-S-oxide reductase